MFLEEIIVFNLIKDDFDENLEDIINSINSILNEDKKQEKENEMEK